MSPDQLTFVLILFGAVVVFGVIVISLTVVVRKRRFGRQRSGPGSPDTPVSSDAWERFGPALAAVYARREWAATKGARRRVTPEQTYFGYACVLPPPMLHKSLAGDWGVRKPEQARRQVARAVGVAVEQAAQFAGARGETPMRPFGD